MSQEIRKRAAGGRSDPTGMSNHVVQDDDDNLLGVGLSAINMLNASPTDHSVAMKLHVPLIFLVLPKWAKEIVISWKCLSPLRPQWRQRYLILIGNFLYKFKQNNSSTPKGSPLPVDLVESNLLGPMEDDEMSPALQGLPAGFHSIFTVVTSGKPRYYAVSTREEALAWVNSLRQARQDAISRKMGHASNMPYPNSWKYFDSLGSSLQKSKARIKAKVEEQNMREMELSGIASGGSLSRGYYG